MDAVIGRTIFSGAGVIVPEGAGEFVTGGVEFAVETPAATLLGLSTTAVERIDSDEDDDPVPPVLPPAVVVVPPELSPVAVPPAVPPAPAVAGAAGFWAVCPAAPPVEAAGAGLGLPLVPGVGGVWKIGGTLGSNAGVVFGLGV